jgi:hypothetical protein
VHDQHFIEAVNCARDLPSGHVAAALRAFDRKTGILRRGWSMFAINRTPGHGGRGQAQVFYDADFLKRHWESYMHVVSIVPRALGGPQTGVVLAK